MGIWRVERAPRVATIWDHSLEISLKGSTPLPMTRNLYHASDDVACYSSA